MPLRRAPIDVPTSPYTMIDPCKALKAIYRLNARMSWLHRIEGVDLSRCFEYARASQAVASLPRGRVLDVGSYRSPFPAFLAEMGCDVTIVDLDPAVGGQRLWVGRALERPTPLLVCVADGTRQPFADAAFDVVTCISTIEHIPGGGDVRAVREICRVLKPRGSCFISVPYSTAPKEGLWGRWFTRWYSLGTAFARLVEPSPLSLSAYGFLMGGVVGKLADIWYRFPRLVRHMLSWSHAFFFPRALRANVASENDARVLWLLLRKE